MHPELASAVHALGITEDTRPLETASNFSRKLVDDSRQFLADKLSPDLPVDVVVFGSIAREEASTASDLDYLVITHGLLDDPGAGVQEVIEALEQLRDDELGLEAPGGTGIFGKLVAAPDLVERVGLEDDTNPHHTRRILLLTESVSILSEDRHEQLLRAIVRRYLADYGDPKPGVPRFLLNDVLRYWRTLAVDYQAKQWGQRAPEWGLRYLKLIISRKLMIASTVVSLFLCEEATDDYFVEQFTIPPIARFCQVRHLLDGSQDEHLRTVLRVAADFVNALEDPDFRDEAKFVRARRDIDPHSRFGEMQEQARSLQTALEGIFFDVDRLRPLARKYLSF